MVDKNVSEQQINKALCLFFNTFLRIIDNIKIKRELRPIIK